MWDPSGMRSCTTTKWIGTGGDGVADDAEPTWVVGSAEAVHKFMALGTVDGLR
jgi:hypothetical protein